MAVAIVQSAHTDPAFTSIPNVVFGTAPTNGNLLIALTSHWPNTPTANTGWTLINNTNASQSGTACAYKYAGAGESTTQNAWNGVGGIGDLPTIMWEISGITGTIGTDLLFDFHDVDIAGVTAGNPATSTSHNTTVNNTLVLGFFAGNVGTGTTQAAPTLGGGHAPNTASWVHTPGVSTHVGLTYFDDLFATSGTAVQYTATWSGGPTQTAEHFLMVFLRGSASTNTETAIITTRLSGASQSFLGSVTSVAGITTRLSGISQTINANNNNTTTTTTRLSGLGQGFLIYKASAPGSGRRLFWTS